MPDAGVLSGGFTNGACGNVWKFELGFAIPGDGDLVSA